MKLKQFLHLFFLLNTFLIIYSCKTPGESKTNNQQENTVTNNNNNQQMIARAPIIIYKTSNNYFNNVPVTLSADKSEIVSYPDIRDIYYKEDLATPTKLVRGFLLDNRGIGVNSAFLKYTYEDYSQLSVTPSPDILYSLIIDKDPFKEIYNMFCERDTAEINKLIKSGLKENCKKIK